MMERAEEEHKRSKKLHHQETVQELISTFWRDLRIERPGRCQFRSSICPIRHHLGLYEVGFAPSGPLVLFCEHPADVFGVVGDSEMMLISGGAIAGGGVGVGWDICSCPDEA